MLPVQLDFIIDGLLVCLKLFFRIPTIFPVFCDAEVLQIHFCIILPYPEVRCVRLAGKEDIISVHRLVLVLNAVQV